MAGYIRRAPVLKEKFVERIKNLLNGNDDYSKFLESIYCNPLNYIRCNTLKISPDELLSKLIARGWKVSQLYKDFKEIMLIESILAPGELGRSREHLLGYYYVQEISSMMPLLALQPCENNAFLDLCAAPGSKTTQAAAMMNNKGLIIANDSSPGRTRILAANCERAGVSNTIISCEEGSLFCKKLLEKSNLRFDKILLDSPCSGEGTLRSSPRAAIDWSMKLIESLSRKQKKLIESAFSILKIGGEMIYSTCTHSPEENEEVIDYLLNKYDADIITINLPIKVRKGITNWNNKTYDKRLSMACRIYPQDNDTEGFFLCKIKKLSDKIK
ncbi:RsmB/NOP family class I SAM-dependent RNA methyltransferase [Candidatus Pacearchaeota archaeon]|nr:RsmB/NOP family class I SAM-dependent RNA methyltransferase [Candidatus Pacearchaeota archaeon]